MIIINLQYCRCQIRHNLECKNVMNRFIFEKDIGVSNLSLPCCSCHVKAFNSKQTRASIFLTKVSRKLFFKATKITWTCLMCFSLNQPKPKKLAFYSFEKLTEVPMFFLLPRISLIYNVLFYHKNIFLWTIRIVV